MRNVLSDKFNSEEEMDMVKALLDIAKQKNEIPNNTKIVIVSNNAIEEYDASKMQKELDYIYKIKEEIFAKINLDEIDEEEYDASLDKYYASIKIKNYKNDEEITKKRYPNIKFENLSNDSLRYLTYGDKLFSYISYENIDDYSAVILQWCRAVELELRNKIYKYIGNKKIKKDITNKSLSSNYYKKQRMQKKYVKPLKVNNMMGFYSAIKKFELEEYIFNTFISKYYKNFSFELFQKIIEYVIIINKYRDESAHSGTSMELNRSSANECKEYIVASKKILEILSNL